MKVFLTGATGFVGSRVLSELLRAGHEVIALVRKQQDADRLAARGVRSVLGSLEDLDVIAQATSNADAVLHTAFIHDFDNYAASCAVDARFSDVVNRALAGIPLRVLHLSSVLHTCLTKLIVRLRVQCFCFGTDGSLCSGRYRQHIHLHHFQCCSR